MSNGQSAMQRLLALGWKQGDPIPQWFSAVNPGINAAAAPEGTPQNPMQLSTMQVQGDASPMGPPQPGPPQPAQAGEGRQGVFAGMSEEDAQKYAGMGELRKQRERAEALRDTEDAKGRYLNQGRTFVAASPLEHLSVGLRRYKGKKKSDVIGEKQTAGRKSLIDLLRDKDAITEEDLEELGY